MSLFSIFYYILSAILYIIALPFIIYKSTKSKYKIALPSRFFLKNNSFFKENRIWFHSCSMGETKSLKPIIDSLDEKVNVSVITNTGYEEALKLNADVRYLPYEMFLPFWIKKQDILVVMEAELWYMLFLSAKMKKTKTVLINARISDRSYKSYKKFSWFYKYIFKNIDKVFAQSEIDKQRLEELGAKNIEVIGNIKLAQLPKVSKILEKPEKIIITAASTHENEEELILNSYKKVQGTLVVVPRHPERFEKVYKLVKEFSLKKGYTYHRYSKKENFDSDIVLVDKMGELINIFSISDVVILGGAFEKIGGHNPIEPAYFNCKIISGKNIFNQKALFECVENYKLIENSELAEVLENIENIEKSKLIKIGSIEPIIKEINGN